jgi:hypothetical protein
MLLSFAQIPRIYAEGGAQRWAHDWQPAPKGECEIPGAFPDRKLHRRRRQAGGDLAVITAGAEIQMMSGWALMGKFDSAFGVGTQTYVGTERARYAW